MTVIFGAEGRTVILQVARFPVSLVLTVIVACPIPFAVTTPFAETVATFLLLDVQVTFLLSAFDGDREAFSVQLFPKTSVFFDALSFTPVVWMGLESEGV